MILTKRQQSHEWLKSLATCTWKKFNFHEDLNKIVLYTLLMVWEPFQNTGDPALQDTTLPGEARERLPCSQYHTMDWTQPPAHTAPLTLHEPPSSCYFLGPSLPLGPTIFHSRITVSHLPLPLSRATNPSQPQVRLNSAQLNENAICDSSTMQTCPALPSAATRDMQNTRCFGRPGFGSGQKHVSAAWCKFSRPTGIHSRFACGHPQSKTKPFLAFCLWRLA